MAGTELRQQARVLDTSARLGPGQGGHAPAKRGFSPGLSARLRSQGGLPKILDGPIRGAPAHIYCE